MKFGKYLEKNQVQEWSDKYISYKQLRKNVKRFKGEIEAIKKGINKTSELKTSSAFIPASSHSDVINTSYSISRSSSIASLSNFELLGSSNNSVINQSSGGVAVLGSPLKTSQTFSRNNTYNNLFVKGSLDRVSTSAQPPITATPTPNLVQIQQPQQPQNNQNDSNGSTEDIQLLLVNQNLQPMLVNGASKMNADTISRLKEIQDEMADLIVAEAEKVNQFYMEREKEALERYSQIYHQLSFLLKLRRREQLKKQQQKEQQEQKELAKKQAKKGKYGKLSKEEEEEEEENRDQEKSRVTPSIRNGADNIPTMIITNSEIEMDSLDSEKKQQHHRIQVNQDEDEEDEEKLYNSKLIQKEKKKKNKRDYENGSDDEEVEEEERDQDLEDTNNNSDEQGIIELASQHGITIPSEEEENGGVDNTSLSTSRLNDTTKQLIYGIKSIPKLLDGVVAPIESKAKKWIKLDQKKNSESLFKDIIFEYYKYLVLLKNYKTINYTAILKIIKKAEKYTELVLATKVNERVSEFKFKQSKTVDKLSTSIEKLYAEVYCNGQLRTARKQIRNSDPTDHEFHRVSTSTTFFSGLFAGWSIAILILIYYLLYTGEYDDFVRFSTVYNLYSTLGLGLLWAFAFGLDIYIWTKAKVHYSFIFELSKSKLTYHTVFQSVSTLSVLWITSIGIYMWSSTEEFPFPKINPVYMPLVLLAIYMSMLFCPWDIFQKPVRKWFLVTIYKIITAPLSPVKFAHFFIADQLSSLVLMMVQFSQFICFYVADVYHPENEAICGKRARYINPFISALPATWRLLQCLRRYHDSRDKVHLRNALKYSLSIVVVFNSTMDSLFSHGWSSPWRIIWLFSGVINSGYSYWWDIFMDWSIIQKPKINPAMPLWHRIAQYNPFKLQLRKKRMYKPTFIYVFAIFSNLGFRTTWTLTKSLPQLVDFLPTYKLVVVIGICEILRRFQWNLYRLENEHINNAGKFRATLHFMDVVEFKPFDKIYKNQEEED